MSVEVVIVVTVVFVIFFDFPVPCMTRSPTVVTQVRLRMHASWQIINPLNSLTRVAL